MPELNPTHNPAPEPQPLAYLDGADNRARGGIDVQLAVGIESAMHRVRGIEPAEVLRSSFRHQYWTLAQRVTLAAGETRTFLEDGHTVIPRGWCEAPGAARIGFCECRGTVLLAGELCP